jgi:hypothetical protein
MLVQTKGLSCEAFDAIAGHGGAEGSRRNGQAQSRAGLLIGQNGQTKICIGKPFAALPHCAKFGRLMQTLARLEGQPLDKIGQ